MDPLSDLLSVLKPRIVGAGGFDLAGLWSIAFPRHEGLKCYAVAQGRCWLAMEDAGGPVELGEGDCLLLPPGPAFRLASDLGVEPVGFGEFVRRGDVRSCNGGGECLIVGGHFALDAGQAGSVLGALAPVVHLRDDDGRAVVRWSLDRMRQELRGEEPETALMLGQLARTILIHVLRRHAAGRTEASAGWPSALADPRVRRAITGIHADPARRWTVAALAREAGASRSSFAQLFTAPVGQPPIGYATTWRMRLAAERLGCSEALTAIARSLGYGSDSAFCAAFRRVTGRSPRGR